MSNQAKVSDEVAILLEQMGIRHAFGIIGAGNVHLFESITRHGYTEIVCVHHEQAATMAMQTYYRTHGKLAAALLTTGGGATNGVTGVVSAWADSVPGLVIAGNENGKFCDPANPLRMWGVQGYDSVQMVEKVTKYAARVTDPTQTLFELEKAAHIALDRRPGPVWIEIPMSVQSTRLDPLTLAHFTPQEVPRLAPADASVQRVVQALREARRPVLWLGHGIRLAGAADRLLPFLETLDIPALVSWAGIDMLDSSHPRVVGRAGVYGQRNANFVLQNSDYILSIGNRMAIPQVGYDLTELARGAQIDVVDIDETEGRKLGDRVREFIHADAGAFIDALQQAATGGIGAKTEWLAQVQTYRETFPWIGTEHDDSDGFINSYRFMERLNRVFKPDQKVVTDMGTALLCGHQVLKFEPGQRLLTSTGLGEMGYGLPAAIGVSFATDRGEVMCLNCDGGMMMNLQELQTIAHHRLPIKLFIFNNDGYLMIKHTQNALFNKAGYVGTNKTSGLSCPDFSKVAAAFDMPAFQIRGWDECDSVLAQVQAHDGPVICEVFMHPEQLFVPKLSVAQTPQGTLVSPPLEDLSPLVPLEMLETAMLVGVHDKSRSLR
ncbi:acetolactate synthase-1/2/3 large subunit [Roseateles sp. YR242]|uniref:thiamine pyrophosphate-binding protein n=1 Tax=Roseateles sp. YR242 TaxID=1855305 RepID=UPI0008CA6D49|nr:thiamine pyrophosphate-binding protein [Roseateles sp. YR242]SEK57177.1 acetolactate synthase-1/2/3 large subunit [Roseateles sp. YR242]